MFKVGDKVTATKNYGERLTEGHVYTIEGINYPYYQVRDNKGVLDGWQCPFWELAPTGPVVTETVTKTRIVPGVWACVWVSYEHEDRLTVQYMVEQPSADQLDAAAAVLSELAKGLRDVD